MRNPTFSAIAVNAKVTAMRVLFQGASIQIFDGQQPKSPEDKISTQTLLAQIPVTSVEFQDDGVLVLLTADSVPALAGGKPTWFRIVEERRGYAILDGTCGPNGDMNVDGDIEADGEVKIEHIVYRESRKWPSSRR